MVDEKNLFALISAAFNTADEIASDTRQTAGDRDAAGRIRDGLKAFRSAAFRFRDWTPAPSSAHTTTGANAA
ncbi:TPA: hypothetical protein QDB28_002157 [Burkholderia vietnamiensis]|nr:hypothetical protein [Burkholderia vietnamiensis]